MKPVLFVLLAALTLASAEDSSSITKAPASTTTADNPYATYPTVAKTASINGFADKIYDDLPECAKPCMFQNTGVTPCPYWDTGCLCVMPQFGGLIGSCIAENCKGSNVVSATSLATSICSSAGVWEPYWMIPASISSSLSVAAADTAVAETSSDPEPTSESSSTALEDVSSTSSTSIPENTSETSDEANSETASTENQSTSLAAEASTSSITDDKSSITEAPSTTSTDNPYATYPTVAKTASINGFADKIYDDLPECAKPCMFQNTGVTPCPYWDTGCLCVMPQFGGLIGSCIAENCKGSNVVSATSLATSICSSAGVWEPYWMIPASISSSLSVAAADTAVAETSSDPEPTSESSSTALEDVSSTSSTSIPENTSETSDEANSETASTENQSTSLAAEASTSSITDDKSSITEAPSTTSTDNPYATYPTVAKTASINGFADKIYDDLPECAKPCMFQNTGVTPCPYWDTGCLCVMPQFGGLIGSCIAENCKGSNVVSATSLATSICSSAGVWEPYWMIPASISSSLSVAAADTAVAETSSDPEPTSEASTTILEDASSVSSTSVPENTSPANEETSDQSESSTTIVDPTSSSIEDANSNITEAPSATSTDNPYATYPTVEKTASINGFADKIYDDLPECAKPCMFQNTGVTPCPYWDTGCLCVMPQFGGLIGSCIAENCKGSNVVSATSLATSICSSAGVWEPYWMIPASISSSLSVAAADTAVAETSSDPEPTSEASSTTSEDISSSEAIVTSTADPEPTSSLSGSSSVEENSSDDVTSFITSSSVESSDVHEESSIEVSETVISSEIEINSSQSDSNTDPIITITTTKSAVVTEIITTCDDSSSPLTLTSTRSTVITETYTTCPETDIENETESKGDKTNDYSTNTEAITKTNHNEEKGTSTVTEHHIVTVSLDCEKCKTFVKTVDGVVTSIIESDTVTTQIGGKDKASSTKVVVENTTKTEGIETHPISIESKSVQQTVAASSNGPVLTTVKVSNVVSPTDSIISGTTQVPEISSTDQFNAANSFVPSIINLLIAAISIIFAI